MAVVETVACDQDIIDVLAREFEEELRSTPKHHAKTAISLAKLLESLENDQLVPKIRSPEESRTKITAKSLRSVNEQKSKSSIAERIGCQVTSQSKGPIKVWTRPKKLTPTPNA